ncbi:MAG: hypothetical protein ACXW2T_00900, partial [Allosphingosinicella sp.]
IAPFKIRKVPRLFEQEDAMKALTKYLTGAAAVVALTVSAAAPADAQYRDRYSRHDRDNIDAGDIITGVAVVGGIAAILGAINNDGSRYGYSNRYRYQNDYRSAVNACAYQAERYAQGGQVSITDIDRDGRNSYRVRGVVDAGGFGGGYDRYGRNDRYDRYDRYSRNDRFNGYNQRVVFECEARANGRITDFDIDRRY